MLEVEGYGPHDVGAKVSRTVFVESTPRWTALASAGTRMQHIDATRVLYVDSADAAGPAVKVRARTGGAEWPRTGGRLGGLDRQPAHPLDLDARAGRHRAPRSAPARHPSP